MRSEGIYMEDKWLIEYAFTSYKRIKSHTNNDGLKISTQVKMEGLKFQYWQECL